MRIVWQLAAVLLLGLGAVKGYFWYSVKSEADAMAERLRPFAEVQYDGIHTSFFSSSMGVEGITITPRGLGETITVESIIYDAPDLRFLFSTHQALRNQRLPESVGFRINGLSLSTDGRLVRQLLAGTDPDDPLAVVFASSCVDGQPLDVSDLEYIGYERIVSDIDVNFTVDQRAKQFSTQFAWAIRRMAEVRLAMTFAADPGDMSFRQTAQSSPKLVSGALTYVDDTYFLGVNNLCAVETDVDVETYVDRRVEAAADTIHALGAESTPTLRKAYRQFAKGNGELTIEVRPDRPLQIENLAYYRPDDIIRLLKPSVTVNGAEMTLRPAAVTQQADTAGADEADGTESGQADNTSAFRRTPTHRLDGFRGRDVRVNTVDGKRHEGRLKRVTEDKIHLEQRVLGGAMVYPILRSDIRAAEVRR